MNALSVVAQGRRIFGARCVYAPQGMRGTLSAALVPDANVVLGVIHAESSSGLCCDWD